MFDPSVLVIIEAINIITKSDLGQWHATYRVFIVYTMSTPHFMWDRSRQVFHHALSFKQ